MIELFDQTRAWLASKGLDQWQRAARVDQVRGDLSAGNVFVGEDNGGIIATVTVDTFADPDFWGPDDDPTSALYLHRMIVDRAHAGSRLGEQLTAWAEEFAAALGYDRLRLDCQRSNHALRRYYGLFRKRSAAEGVTGPGAGVVSLR